MRRISTVRIARKPTVRSTRRMVRKLARRVRKISKKGTQRYYFKRTIFVTPTGSPYPYVQTNLCQWNAATAVFGNPAVATDTDKFVLKYMKIRWFADYGTASPGSHNLIQVCRPTKWAESRFAAGTQLYTQDLDYTNTISANPAIIDFNPRTVKNLALRKVSLADPRVDPANMSHWVDGRERAAERSGVIYVNCGNQRLDDYNVTGSNNFLTKAFEEDATKNIFLNVWSDCTSNQYYPAFRFNVIIAVDRLV